MKLCATRIALCLPLLAPLGHAADIPRTMDGRPDLTGTYDVSTATRLERPDSLGERMNLTRTEAEELAARMREGKKAAFARSDPDRGAPTDGNVGSYNSFYLEYGDSAFQIDGKYRASIVIDPANGRRPAMTSAGAARLKAFYRQHQDYGGGAWWLEEEGPGPFDGPETLTPIDRCLLGRGVPGGPPVLPTVYNNMKRIVQTPDHVMILIEMVHDARIVRLNSKHLDPSIRKWLGDSIGWWEGDTLVVDTTNFNDTPSLTGASRELHVVERFRRVDAQTLLYSFTVNDPGTWTGSWSGEYPWPQTSSLVYEYACHEGNHAMTGILRGARYEEGEAVAEQ